MFKLLHSSKGSDELAIGFDRSRNGRKDELALNKNEKGKDHVGIMLKDVSDFVECQEKASYCLGDKLTLTREKDDSVTDKAAGTADARIKIDHIQWYVPHYTPNLQQEKILTKQTVDKIPTELRYVERSVFMEEVNNQNLWNFEVGSQESMNVRIWIIIVFQQLLYLHQKTSRTLFQF